MSKIILTAVVAGSLLMLAGGPLHGRSNVVLRDGKTFSGEIEEAEYRLISADGGELRVPRASLHRLEATEGGMHSLTLKDDTTVAGTLEADLELVDGLVTRVFSAADLASVDFDVYVPVDTALPMLNVCPVRAELSLDELVMSKSGKLTTSVTRRVRCDDAFVSNLTLRLRRNVRQTRVPKGAEPQEGFELEIKPVVLLPNGRDKDIHLSFILVHEARELARDSQLFEADEGELNRGAPLRLWFQADADPFPTLRVQMVTTASAREREKGTVFWWFTIRP